MICINNKGVDKALKHDKVYEKLTEDDTCFIVKNELGQNRRYHKSRFRVLITELADDLENLHVTIPREHLQDIYSKYTYDPPTKAEVEVAEEEIQRFIDELYAEETKPTVWQKIKGMLGRV